MINMSLFNRFMATGAVLLASSAVLAQARPGIGESDQPQRGVQQRQDPQGQQRGQDEMRARMGGMEQQRELSESQRQDIRSALGSTIYSAFKGDYSDVVDNLSKSDRDRLGNQRNTNDFQQAAQQLSQEWENKYQERLDWTDNDTLRQVFRNAQYQQVSKNNAQLTIPGPSGQPSMTLALVDEGTLGSAWRINVPDSLSGDQLKKNLINHMNEARNSKDRWPQDRNAAGEMVAYHILMPLQSGQTGQGGHMQHQQ